MPSGLVSYVVDSVLYASAFDAARLVLGDERVPLVQGVRTSFVYYSADYALADNGMLVYVPSTPAATRPDPAERERRNARNIVWAERDVSTVPLNILGDNYTMVRVSHDGRRIALVTGDGELFLFEPESGNPRTELTFDLVGIDGPVWSCGDSRIYFRARGAVGTGIADGVGGGSRYALYAYDIDSGRAPVLMAPLPQSSSGLTPIPWSMSCDEGKLLLVDARSLARGDVGIVTLDVEQPGSELEPLLEAASEPSLSPNGRWLLFQDSRQTGASAGDSIAVAPYSSLGNSRTNVASGTSPLFSADASEIFFFVGNGLAAVSFEPESGRIGEPQPLRIRGRYWYGVGGPSGERGRAWDADPTQDRFLMITMPEDVPADGGEDGADDPARIRVVLSAFGELP